MSAAVGVLVPIRGDAAFLGEALDSLRAQTSVDWVALLCPLDDAAAALAAKHAGDHPRMRIAGTHLLTESEALVEASATIDSEFLCVLDGDDMLEPAAFATLLEMLRAESAAGMAYSRHVLIDVIGRVLGPGPLCELPYSADALLLDFMTGPLRLMRTSAYRDAGGHLGTHPDAIEYDLCLRLSETSAIVHAPHALYRRRIHPHAAEVARWSEGIEARYGAFVDAVKRRGLDATHDIALQIDSWHILQPLRPFGGAGNWG